MDEAERIAKLIVPPLTGSDLDDWFRSLATPRLKEMWDNVDEYHVYCDEIHMAMNERGQGGYVAV